MNKQKQWTRRTRALYYLALCLLTFERALVLNFCVWTTKFSTSRHVLVALVSELFTSQNDVQAKLLKEEKNKALEWR